MDKNLRSYLTELAGTFALVFVSAGAVIATHLGGESGGHGTTVAQRIYVALAVGFVYAAILAITMPYEGGYLNPAITLTRSVSKRFEAQDGALFSCSFSAPSPATSVLIFPRTKPPCSLVAGHATWWT